MLLPSLKLRWKRNAGVCNMNGCIMRTKDGRCMKFTTDEVRSWCVDGPCEYAIPSNGDHFRSMTDEDLAKFLSNVMDCNICPNYYSCEDHTGFADESCEGMMLDWLQGEYIDGEL